MVSVTVSNVTDRMGRPLRDLRVSVTDACNFRCTYCMPAELYGDGYPFLPPDALFSFDEITAFVRHAVTLGVEKVKITGGEPLLRPGVHTLVEQVASIPGISDVGLITNGYHLAAAAQRLRDAGLSRITVSLDSLREETFARIAGRGGILTRVLEGVAAAQNAGFDPVKINMVVQRGVNDDEVVAVAQWAREEGLELRYIEYMDVGRRHDFAASRLVPSAEIRDAVGARFPIEPVDAQYYGEVAETYRYLDGGGRIGFISSMTQPFCGTCTRLRLSADGILYRCLFSGIGLEVRSMMRSGQWDELDRAVRRFWGIREDRYSELRGVSALGEAAPVGSRQSERVEMYRMGG